MVTEPRQALTGVRQLSLGYQHSLFLAQDGRLFGCGMNANFELGLGIKDGADRKSYDCPVEIRSAALSDVTEVRAGCFSAAISGRGHLLIWGTGEFGQIKSPQKLFMDKVMFSDCRLSKFHSVNADSAEEMLGAAAIAIDMRGHTYTWGDNRYGRLGHGDTRARKLPSQILSLKRKAIRDIAIGGDFVIMLGKDVTVGQAEVQKERDSSPFDLSIIDRVKNGSRAVATIQHDTESIDRQARESTLSRQTISYTRDTSDLRKSFEKTGVSRMSQQA